MGNQDGVIACRVQGAKGLVGKGYRPEFCSAFEDDWLGWFGKGVVLLCCYERCWAVVGGCVHRLMRLSGLGEGLVNITEYIINVFDANRQANHTGINATRRQLLR